MDERIGKHHNECIAVHLMPPRHHLMEKNKYDTITVSIKHSVGFS